MVIGVEGEIGGVDGSSPIFLAGQLATYHTDEI